jgi:hypothetical protein
MFERLADKCPSCERKRLDALVAVWSRELELILKRMFTICAEGAPLRLPEEVRHEAAFELARLTLWLEDKIVAVRTSATPIDELDPETEERSVNSPEGQQRIDNTARMCAEQIWKRLQEDWWKRFPAIRKAPARRGKILTASGRSQGVRQQHFSPAFSNKLWANEPDKKVTVYARGVDNKITSKHVPYRSWGRESFIYSQKLEQLFGLIEGDAKKPYTKLLNADTGSHFLRPKCSGRRGSSVRTSPILRP